jgi:hypothetical protein
MLASQAKVAFAKAKLAFESKFCFLLKAKFAFEKQFLLLKSKICF